MSRDLEKEYRAFVDSEVPDLWARIEAGLEEKKPAADTPVENVRDRKVNFRIWAGLAAACVCAALIVPAMVRNAGTAGGSSYSDSAPAPAAHTAPQAAKAYERTEDTAGQEAAVCEEAFETTGSGQEQYRFHATVEILEVDVSMDSGVLYTAKVLLSDQPGMEPDSEIQIFCSMVSPEGTEMMETGRTYDLVLSRIESDDPEQGVKYLLVDE